MLQSFSKQVVRVLTGLSLVGISTGIVMVNAAQADPWQIVYPPQNHTTRADAIFFIGTAPADTQVMVNGRSINRSPSGHFAPSFPLAVGTNTFTFTLQPSSGAPQTYTRAVTRVNPVRTAPAVTAIVEESISPRGEVWRRPGDVVCFEAIATPNSDVSVRLWDSEIPMVAETAIAALPAANAILTGEETADSLAQSGRYQGCGQLPEGRAGQETVPEIVLSSAGQTVVATAGLLRVLDPQETLLARATTDRAIARNGPNSNYIRYSPWPLGTQSEIIGRENDWLETASGAWIAMSQSEVISVPAPVQGRIGSVRLERQGDWTELQVPMTAQVPFNVTEEPGQLILDVEGAALQTDFFRMDASDPLIEDVSWSQADRDRVRFVLHLTRDYVWGYEADYVGTTLVLRVRQVPEVDTSAPLDGLRIVVDPGHGGDIDLGARGPNGTPEKAVNLDISLRLAQLLRDRGAEVILTRTTDAFVALAPRAQIQRDLKPDLFLSIHYNALPDSGDAENTAGIQTFWYFPHSRELARRLHEDLVVGLGQPDAGFFFSSLAVIRATPSPSVLLELGYMINPTEFELITSASHQERTVSVLVDSLEGFLQESTW